MDSTERRRINRLLRKAAPPSLNKPLYYKQKLSRNVQKQTKLGPNPTEKLSKQEINVDVASLCAEMCGVCNLSPGAMLLLQRHLNQIARLLVHSVMRVMEQSRRGMPQASDIDLASILCGLENPFGTMTSSFLPIRTGGRIASCGPGGKVFFIRPDKEIDVKALLLREPAGVVYDVSLVAHWLSVNGIQPTSPQNPPPDFLKKMSLLNNNISKIRKSDLTPEVTKAGDSYNISQSEPNGSKCLNSELSNANFSHLHPRKVLAISVDRRTHEISQELMIYFRELTEACVGASENRRHEALDNATLDPGLQPILPHLMTFIAEGVRINVTNHNLAILIYLMRLVKALIDNPHISLEPYLHLLVPTVITCVLNRQLCAKPITDNHWALRDFAAKQLVTLCNRHNTSTNELYTRVTRELSRALCNWIDATSSTANVPDNSSLKLTSFNVSSRDKMDCKLFENTDSLHNAGTIDTSSTIPSGVGVSTGNSSASTGGVNGKGPSLGSAVHSLNTLYGILVSLAEFGAQCLRIMVFPLLSSLCHRLTILTEPPSNNNNNNNNNNSTNSVSSSLLLNTSVTDSASQNSLISLGLINKLSAVDQRSFDFLKVMMMNRIAPLLLDWRLRQGLGINQEDYRNSYECMATCLFVKNQTASSSSSSTTTTTFSTPTTVTGGVSSGINTTSASANAVNASHSGNNSITPTVVTHPSTTISSVASLQQPALTTISTTLVTDTSIMRKNSTNNDVTMVQAVTTTSSSLSPPTSSSMGQKELSPSTSFSGGHVDNEL